MKRWPASSLKRNRIKFYRETYCLDRFQQNICSKISLCLIESRPQRLKPHTKYSKHKSRHFSQSQTTPLDFTLENQNHSLIASTLEPH